WSERRPASTPAASSRAATTIETGGPAGAGGMSRRNASRRWPTTKSISTSSSAKAVAAARPRTIMSAGNDQATRLAARERRRLPVVRPLANSAHTVERTLAAQVDFAVQHGGRREERFRRHRV